MVESTYTYVRVAAAGLPHGVLEHRRTVVTLATLPRRAAHPTAPRRPGLGSNHGEARPTWEEPTRAARAEG